MSDEPLLDPAAAQVVARVRRLMLMSALFTLLAVAGVLAVVGYRLFRHDAGGPPADASAALPRGAKVVGSTASDDRLVLTVEVNGLTEIHLFDLRTLQPRGRLRLQPAP